MPPNDSSAIHSIRVKMGDTGISQIILIPFVASRNELIMSINTGF